MTTSSSAIDHRIDGRMRPKSAGPRTMNGGHEHVQQPPERRFEQDQRRGEHIAGMHPDLPPVFERTIIDRDIGGDRHAHPAQKGTAEHHPHRVVIGDKAFAGTVDDRAQAGDQEREQEQAGLTDRAVQRELRPVMRRPALRRDHAHPDARRDTVRVELPRHRAPHAEIARPEATGDDRQHDKNGIMRFWIRHRSPPSPPIPHKLT
uniref:hypothetical protein n=1 Tax=Sphingomonas bacterium TaxID=1895847 RepID=UPI00260EA172|nr:hypothetical protein [Sphingomonas bacterium]